MEFSVRLYRNNEIRRFLFEEMETRKFREWLDEWSKEKELVLKEHTILKKKDLE
jgi:hypothetical protein